MSILLENLSKRYDGHPVVYNVSLEIAEGEFFVLLGPSGSGKSTILNMIAGLTEVDQGRVLLHGRDVTGLTPQTRQVGFVFQNYALFQHMSVADNIEFGLSVRKVVPAERQRRRDELLDLVGLAGLGRRMPHQLSGGQQQRVALARALAHRPEVLLLDEPLGALDAKIRTELRRTLKVIQRELGLTTILVTHDQEEAFELADRLGVMSFGRLLEVGPPQELYHRPQTEFVATFLGTANLLVGERCEPKGVQVGSVCFPLETDVEQISNSHRVQVLFRPEDIELGLSAQALTSPQLGLGEVEQTTFVGSFERLRLRLPPIPGVRPIAPPVAFGGGSMIVEATRSQDQVSRLPLQPGNNVWVGVRRVHALAHPGLNVLIVSDGSAKAQAALMLGGQMAQLAHARLTMLGYGASPDTLQRHLQAAKEKLGSGLAYLELRTTPAPLAQAVLAEVERQPYDLVVLGFQRQENVELAEQILQMGEHHLLLVSQPQPTPAHALICVASGEPGKADVLFAGRLVRHVGAEATLLSVLSAEENETSTRSRTERFLAGGVRSLQLLGVPARAAIRSGPVRDEITREVTAGNYDLLVLGAPLAARDGKISLAGVVSQVLNVINRPVLIVRSGI
jgi:sulfate/thiosulfate transport system ATP-binding protein